MVVLVLHQHYQAVEKRLSAVFPSSFAFQRTLKYASRLRISGALHLAIPYLVLLVAAEGTGPGIGQIPKSRAGIDLWVESLCGIMGVAASRELVLFLWLFLSFSAG